MVLRILVVETRFVSVDTIHVPTEGDVSFDIEYLTFCRNNFFIESMEEGPTTTNCLWIHLSKAKETRRRRWWKRVNSFVFVDALQIFLFFSDGSVCPCHGTLNHNYDRCKNVKCNVQYVQIFLFESSSAKLLPSFSNLQGPSTPPRYQYRWLW
jgi:hypothetical protein